MLIKEYRIPMPMSVEEYRIAQLYMIQVRGRLQSMRGREGEARGRQGGGCPADLMVLHVHAD